MGRLKLVWNRLILSGHLVVEVKLKLILVLLFVFQNRETEANSRSSRVASVLILLDVVVQLFFALELLESEVTHVIKSDVDTEALEALGTAHKCNINAELA